MEKLIACEIGNFDTKLLAEDMVDLSTGQYKEEPICILNLISVGRERRSFDNQVSGTKDKSLINLLDVTIETEADHIACGRWFVGGLAFKEGKKLLKANKKTKKAENPQTIISLLTSLAYYLYDPKKPIKTERIKLGTLLPTEEFFPTADDNNDYADIYENKLVGKKHKVKFNDPAFVGAEITIEIVEPEISPEGTVAQMASIYNWDFKVKPEMEGLEYKKIMNIDFGSIDTNVSILENGNFEGNGIFGFKGGTIEVLNEIAADIYTKEGHKFDTFKLDYHIRTKKPLYLGDKDISIMLQEESTRKFSKAGWEMANAINSEFDDRGIDPSEVSIINFTGGGTQFFRESVEPVLKGKYTKIISPQNPRFANVEGTLKDLIFKRYQAEGANNEVFED